MRFLCLAVSCWQCLGQKFPVGIVMAKIEELLQYDPNDHAQFMDGHQQLAKFTYKNFWAERFSGPFERTRFSKKVASNFIHVTDMLDKLQDTLWDAIYENCLKRCPQPFVCNLRTLKPAAESAVIAFMERTTIHLKFADITSIIDDLHLYLTAAVMNFISQYVLGSQPDCSDPKINGVWLTRFMVALNVLVNMQLHHLYAILATQAVDVNRSQRRMPEFDMFGAECLSPLLCDSRVELGKALLSNFSAASTELVYAAEIGTYLGNWSLTVAQDVKNVVMLAVDPYDCELDCYPATNDAFELVQALAAPLHGRYQLIRQTSVNASKWIGDGILSLLFIDGDHSYEACSNDVRHWAPKVISGGVIMFHDYWLPYSEVMRCILESHARLSAGPLYVSLNFMAYFYV